MDAFIEIIEKLVECVPSHTWLEQNHFPFSHLDAPKGRLYDVCLFETNAQGAYGLLWIEFQDSSALFIYPFNLARHKEDGDLISLAPWSLRNAATDRQFYASWRSAQKVKNPMITARKAHFFHKKFSGDPSFVAMNIWSDLKSTCVRLDFQVAYKIYRTLEKKFPQSIEVETLTYLGTQSTFKNFAPLTTVFEYKSADFLECNVAIGMRYAQNNGVLFPRFVSLLHKARFPQKFKERSSLQAWDELLHMTQSLGMLLGDFHKAMSLAPRNSELAPEPNSKASFEEWFAIVSKVFDERLSRVMGLQKYYPNFSGIFYLLPSYAEALKASVSALDDIGMRIRNHGHIHLGQVLIGMNELILLDFDGDDYDDPLYRRMKHPCLKDLASMIISLRFSWYFTERKYYALLFENQEKLEIKASYAMPLKDDQSSRVTPSYVSLIELESHFLKFYRNSLEENITSTQLRPKQSEKEKILFNFCFLLRVMKEISRENPEGNPRPRVWLHILQDFIVQ
jgi:predicted trehalose synthase